MFEKLIGISETNNPLAKSAVKKLTKVLEKNSGFKMVATLGESISAPSRVGIYSFARCTSVDVERFFSILSAFIADHPHILDETLLKLLFIKFI